MFHLPERRRLYAQKLQPATSERRSLTVGRSSLHRVATLELLRNQGAGAADLAPNVICGRTGLSALRRALLFLGRFVGGGWGLLFGRLAAFVVERNDVVLLQALGDLDVRAARFA